ncbi:MAG: hypothetical protein HUU55_16070 [Myxococcales bacterium]|nr:hypothetical protein [Myxococcales bacterium]
MSKLSRIGLCGLFLWWAVGCGDDDNGTNGGAIDGVGQDVLVQMDADNSETQSAGSDTANGGGDTGIGFGDMTTDTNADVGSVADASADLSPGNQDVPTATDSDGCENDCDVGDLFTLDAVEAQDGSAADMATIPDLVDSGMDSDIANETDTSQSGLGDASTEFPDSVGMTVAELLIGRWEMVGIKDSGNPFEPVPPGAQFFIFTEDVIKFQCENPNGAPYNLLQNDTVIEVQLGPDSKVMWKILELDAEDFAFYEGGDEFFLKRRKPCPDSQ